MVAFKPYDSSWFSEDEQERLLPLLETAEQEGWREWIRTRSDYQAVLDGCTFDIRRAERFREFCRKFIRQVNGRFKGKPLELFDWQWRWFVAPLFGWITAAGYRRHQRAYISVAKKNGKTALAAAIELYFLIADGENGANCYSAANDRSQAKICYGEALKYVMASPKLKELITKKRLKVAESTHRITFPETYSFFSALSRETCTSEGIDAHLVVFDELHMAINQKMYDVLKFAGSARTQPLFLIITTAGDNTLSICYKEYSYAKQILAGEVVDTGYLPCVFEAPADADPGNQETWRMANPSLGLTVNEETLRDEFKQASAMNQLTNFRHRHLNQWVSPFTKVWIPGDQWAACAGQFTEEEVGDLPCYMGLDLGSTDDLSALVLVWRDEGEDKYYVKPYFWVPDDTVVTRQQAGFVPYLQWVQDGWIMTTDGAATDLNVIQDFVLAKAASVNLQEFAYDPHQAWQMVSALEAQGITTVKIPPGITHQSAPTKLLEQITLDGRLVHDNSPVMSWMVGNVSTFSNLNNDKYPAKKRSKDKIDGVSALVNALARLCVIREGEAPLYNRTGLLFV